MRLKFVKAKQKLREDISGGIMRKVTNEDIIQINELYYKYKNKAEVARQTGWSASTVSKYVDKNYAPPAPTEIVRVDMSILPTEFNTDIFNIPNLGDLCVLTEDEKEDIINVWKELAL
jgi:hypothetical protein